MLAAALAARIALFTGASVTLDPHLAPPDCTVALQIAWVPPGRGAVSVGCAAPAWRLFVPVAAPVSPVPPAIRRGDVVAVVAAGPGFRISVDAVAEADAAAGTRVRLRNKASGEPLQALVGADGQMWLTGFKSGDDGR